VDYNKKTERIGETRVMNNGMKATIIEYKNCDNIIVQLENGVKKNVKYSHYKRGRVGSPMIYNTIENYIECENPNIRLKFLIDKEDIGILGDKFWYLQNTGYVNNKKGIPLHRLIMNCPKGKYIDHINGNKLDNRKANLRICTNAENLRNRAMTKKNKSGYKGVHWSNRYKKWVASIGKNYKVFVLGQYNTPEEAYAAYCKAAMELHGEFANTG